MQFSKFLETYKIGILVMQTVTILSSSLYSIILHELIEVIFVYFNKLLILIVIKCDSHNIYLSTALYLQEVIINDCLHSDNTISLI